MSNRGKEITLATRGSDLAIQQSGEVKAALEDRRFSVELVEVATTGDKLDDALITELGKTGAFVRDLDQRVLDGEVDGAIHSMKDMPTEHPSELIVAGVPERASANDVLITPDGKPIDALPEGAVVGTSSLRRKAQLLNHRPDLTVEPLRGNVDTRIEKLLAPVLQAEHEERTEEEKERKAHSGKKDSYEFPYDKRVEEWFDDLSEVKRRALERDVETEYDAIVLAEAGLQRSGLAHHVEYDRLPQSQFVPAPGQGALAVTTLDNELSRDINTVLDHPRTRVETTVERTILRKLNGGCIAPIGVHAIIQGENVHVEVQVFSQDGSELISLKRDVPIQTHVTGAKKVAEELADKGARELIAEARKETEGSTTEESAQKDGEGK
ncbi:hydroxymethylbilane synthase [Haladaptatus pallidirubidus]|nr:hydroxymethylbilane synthase [Haladaptatus pallidirubidus]